MTGNAKYSYIVDESFMKPSDIYYIDLDLFSFSNTVTERYYSSTAYFKIGFYIYLLQEQSQHSWKTQKLTLQTKTLKPSSSSTRSPRDPVTTKIHN